MARAYPLTDLVKLVRAYGVLAGTSDMERVLAGTLSREWIAKEVEHLVPLSSLPVRLFETQRGRDLLAAELFAKQDIDPETIKPETLDIRIAGSRRMINSNRLPKLEPIIHQAVLAANMLLGVRLYGSHGNGTRTMTHDLIVATMLQDSYGKSHRYSAFSSHDHEIVDDTYVFTWFGDTVGKLVITLAEYLALFNESVDAGLEIPEPPSPEIATAVAAIQASRLRLVARAAGDRVISFMDRDQSRELEAAGIDCSADFPERPAMEKHYKLTIKAFKLPGVDHYALREPLRNTLLMAVRDALRDPAKRERLSGRRGKAVHEVHINLPVMEYFAVSEAPNSIEAVHVASLEMMRSLEKGRRKSLSSMAAHAFRISAIAERVLGRALEPLIVTLAMLHDVVEDGSMRVTGYGHSLRKIQFRFGGPIAAMVSELTDSSVLSAGANKANLTLKQPHLLLPQAQYNVGRFTDMTVKATEAEVPYTLAGIVIKLLDTVISIEEGIRDPELMSGHWRHSGARIYWAERDRGSIVRPLVERLLIEIKTSADPEYASRPHHVNAVRLQAGCAILETVLMYQDMYATQNLAILAHEFGLDSTERETLISLFFDRNVNEEQFDERVFVGLLDDEKLHQNIEAGELPCIGYTTLYAKDATLDSPRKVDTFIAYRSSALRRQEMRRELGIDSTEKLTALTLRQEQVLRMYDRTLQSTAKSGRSGALAELHDHAVNAQLAVNQ
ncbi:HD domain-containing protein [Granulosicoccus antarcticus]|uniref:Uncharacterized protein n=1 Tax=Granulosicoccus antarcticus IMCC3135 TaxID=1192854 RepID=A0A2Z2NYX6_9GAMM|nr:HD domain-containing protein [Granulosicoccus antarcticus]ASJ75121.1 hypothetical protein IMCC3135_25290 [Granulosicoccus antarcticus IMCC3135]